MVTHHYDSDGNLIIERDGVTLTIPRDEVADFILWAGRHQPDKIEAEIGGVDPIR
jgi:hypothetical protein